MAESLSDHSDNSSKNIGKSLETQLSREGFPSILECAVCLQACVHPARLPCNHIFCFLCLKGLVTQGRRCAMCRQEIPADYLDNPDILEYPQSLDRDPRAHKWFYEGRNGWWQYDERNCAELESAYKNGQRTCDLLIAGTLYVANFDQMLQVQKNDRARWRRIKRDLATVPKKGVAGLPIDVVPPPPPMSGDESNQSQPQSSDSGNTPSTSFTQYRSPEGNYYTSSESEDSDTNDGYESNVEREVDEDELNVEREVGEDELNIEREVDEDELNVEREVDENGYRFDRSDTESDSSESNTE